MDILKELKQNKYLKLVSTNESKGIIKKYEELWSRIRDLIWSINKNSDECDEKIRKTILIQMMSYL